MTSTAAIVGWKRTWVLLGLKLRTLVHFLPLLFGTRKGDPAGVSRLSPLRFVQFARRLKLFLSKLDHNKPFRLGNGIRLDLYVPTFPSRAFYHGCQKFLEFENLPPCVTVLISVTAACRFACEHCYQRFDRGRDVPVEMLEELVRRLQDRGVAFFNIEGGEPFLVFERLKRVLGAIDSRSEVWVNSTGDGITVERLRELRARNLTAVMFSLHTADPERLNGFMGSPTAWETLTRGVAACHEAGVPVTFNTCLGRESFHNGEFEAVMEKARELGGCLVQLIQPKPAGAWLEAGPAKFSRADFEQLERLVHKYNHDPRYASYPAIAAQVLEEDASRFGCTAGGVDRFYINAKGDVQPCEFLNISFGNILQEDFGKIYGRMRETFAKPGENWLCEACAPQMRALFQDRKGLGLPLPPECLPEIAIPAHQGRSTAFYEQIRALGGR